jgi:hypothetical protein
MKNVKGRNSHLRYQPFPKEISLTNLLNLSRCSILRNVKSLVVLVIMRLSFSITCHIQNDEKTDAYK